MRLVHSFDLFLLGCCIWQQKQFRFLTILATGCFTCQYGRFIRAVPLGVSIPAQLRPPGRFLLWFWPVASGRRGWDVLHRPGHWLHQPSLVLLHPKPQPSASSLPTRLWSVLPSHRHPTNPSSSSPSKSWSDSYFFCPSFHSSTNVQLTEPTQQPSAAGWAAQPLSELALQPPSLHLEQQPSHQDAAAFTHPDLPLHPWSDLLFHYFQRRILVSGQRGQGESPTSGGPQGRAPEPTWRVWGQQQLSQPDSCSWQHVHSIIPPTHAKPLQLIHEWPTGLQLGCPLLQPWSLDQPLVLPETPQQDEDIHSRWGYIDRCLVFFFPGWTI